MNENSNFVKRAFDAVFALFGMIISAPILLLCAIAIKVDSKGPVFFYQTRVGRYGRLFRMFKLRTMIHSNDQNGPILTVRRDSRITRVGGFLRFAKLDELPQLYNVLRGEMSFVGPRPEVPEFVAGYTSTQREVLNFVPGITGPASLGCIREEDLLSGQNNAELFYRQRLLPAKLKLDLEYCKKATFASDLRLLAATLCHIVRPINRLRGIS